MKIDITGKNINITEAMKTITEKKMQKLNKYVILGDDVKARVLARTYKKAQKIEVTVWSDVGILRSEVMADDYYAALDLAIDKIVGQIRKQKTRLIDRHKEHVGKALFEESVENDNKEAISIKTKSIHVDPMDVDEATMRMELLGHSFFAYIDDESGKPAIVYHRHDNTYGCLEFE